MAIESTEERQRFLRQEREAFQSFVRRHPSDDGVYSRRYRCACGFQTAASDAIWDHVTGCAAADQLDGV